MILNPKIEKSPYRGRGDTPSPRLGRFAPSPSLYNYFQCFFFTLIFMPAYRPILAVSNSDRSIFPCIARSEKSMAECVINSGNIVEPTSGYFVIFITRLRRRTCALQSRIAHSVTMERRSFARTLLWRNNHTQGTLFAVYRIFRQALDAQCWFDYVFATFHARKLCAM